MGNWARKIISMSTPHCFQTLVPAGSVVGGKAVAALNGVAVSKGGPIYFTQLFSDFGPTEFLIFFMAASWPSGRILK